MQRCLAMRDWRSRLLVTTTIGLAWSAAVAAGVAAAPRQPVTALLASRTMYAAYAPWVVAQKMGYFADEGLDVRLDLVPGSTDVVKLLAANSADVGAPSPEPVIISYANGTAHLRYFYTMYRSNIYGIAVPESSRYRKVEELAGKLIGVTSMGSAAVPMARAVFKARGIDPDRGVTFVPVGEGPQAAHAVNAGQVDALAMWDAMFASIANAGAPLRILDTPEISRFPSNSLVATDAFLARRPEVAVKVGRAIAKATLFSLTNPEAAIRMMWQLYPETRPVSLSEAEALANDLRVFNARRPRFVLDDAPVKKWGYNDPAAYQGYIDFHFEQGLINRRFDASAIITNAYIDQINDFDAAAVVAQAKNWRP